MKKVLKYIEGLSKNSSEILINSGILKKMKIVSLACSLIIGGLVILNGCDVCDSGEPSKPEEGDIYFTALSANSNLPSIFRVNFDGSNLREVIKNGILYSSPSLNKKISYLSTTSLAERYAFIANIDGSNATQVGADFWNSRQYPVLSPDGSKVAVFTGNKSLWVIYNQTDFQKASSKFCEGTIPSFSPDGSKMAIYEGNDLYSQLTVKIIDVSKSPPQTIIEKAYTSGIMPWKDEQPSVRWTADGEYIVFMLSDNTYFDYIHYTTWYNFSNEQVIEMSGAGAFTPSMSLDRNKIIYAGRDGNIWIRYLNENKRVNLTSINSAIGYCIYPQWTPDEKNIFYTKYFRDDMDKFHATLEVVNMEADPPQIRVLGNNVFRAFWNKK